MLQQCVPLSHEFAKNLGNYFLPHNSSIYVIIIFFFCMVLYFLLSKMWSVLSSWGVWPLHCKRHSKLVNIFLKLIPVFLVQFDLKDVKKIFFTWQTNTFQVCLYLKIVLPYGSNFCLCQLCCFMLFISCSFFLKYFL